MGRRDEYLAKYRSEHKEYFAEKSREQYEEGKRLFGKQARVATRKFFVGEPVVGMSMIRKPITITFD
jgi:hypothetical protein